MLLLSRKVQFARQSVINRGKEGSDEGLKCHARAIVHNRALEEVSFEWVICTIGEESFNRLGPTKEH